MTKYDAAFRHRIVAQYLAGGAGVKALAKRHGIGCATLRRWIAAYQVHGKQGLCKKYSTYSAPFKLQVLEYMWRNALSYGQVSAVFDLRGRGSVGRWERQYHGGGFDALQPRPKGRRPTMPNTKPIAAADAAQPADERSRDELLRENEYLRAEVAYLKKLDELLRKKTRATAQPKPRKS